MARPTFGEGLRRERELRDVSMDELTKATRISTRFVQALENEDWAKLPGGIFGHVFVRTIARYLGLNEEALLGDYDLARAEHSAATPQKLEQRIPSPPKWLPVLAVFLLLLLLTALFYAGRFGRAHPRGQQTSSRRRVACRGDPSLFGQPAVRGDRRGLLRGVAGIERQGHAAA